MNLNVIGAAGSFLSETTQILAFGFSACVSMLNTVLQAIALSLHLVKGWTNTLVWLSAIGLICFFILRMWKRVVEYLQYFTDGRDLDTLQDLIQHTEPIAAISNKTAMTQWDYIISKFAHKTGRIGLKSFILDHLRQDIDEPVYHPGEAVDDRAFTDKHLTFKTIPTHDYFNGEPMSSDTVLTDFDSVEREEMDSANENNNDPIVTDVHSHTMNTTNEIKTKQIITNNNEPSELSCSSKDTPLTSNSTNTDESSQEIERKPRKKRRRKRKSAVSKLEERVKYLQVNRSIVRRAKQIGQILKIKFPFAGNDTATILAMSRHASRCLKETENHIGSYIIKLAVAYAIIPDPLEKQIHRLLVSKNMNDNAFNLKQ